MYDLEIHSVLFCPAGGPPREGDRGPIFQLSTLGPIFMIPTILGHVSFVRSKDIQMGHVSCFCPF